MIDYNEYSYVFPPRPEKKIHKSLLDMYENKGWIAQLKKNGTCTVVFARGNDVIFKTRHNDDHKQWSPLDVHKRAFQGLSDRWNVFCCELLHSKTKNIKNHLYAFDVVVLDGHHLVGTTFTERQEIVRNSLTSRLSQNLSLAENHASGFLKLFESLSSDEDEGIVLKRADAKLAPCFHASSNSSWQIKCRRKTENYSF